MNRWGLTVVGTALTAACGGRVQTGAPTRADAADPAATGASTGSTSGLPSGLVILPECRLGFSTQDGAGRPCIFVVEGRCYQKKLDACACACKKASGTLCSNGFPEPDGTTLVTCG